MMFEGKVLRAYQVLLTACPQEDASVEAGRSSNPSFNRRQTFNESLDFVPHTPVMEQSFFFCRRIGCKVRRIIKARMKDSRPGGEEWTGFVSSIAYGDDIIEFHVSEHRNIFRPLLRHVDAGFRHDLPGARVHSLWLDTCRVGLDQISFQMPCPCFGHLTAAGIPGTQEQNLELFHWISLLSRCGKPPGR